MKNGYTILGLCAVVGLICLIVVGTPKTYPHWDNGEVTDKYIKTEKFLFIETTKYYFELDAMHKSKRVKEVSEEMYYNVPEGKQYCYIWGYHTANLSENIDFWWE